MKKTSNKYKIDILRQASSELKSLIDKVNEAKKNNLSEEHDFHDYQTCQELMEIAEELTSSNC